MSQVYRGERALGVETESLVQEMKAAYDDTGLNCGDGLHPPALDTDIHAVEAELGLPIPPELRMLWRTHGGQNVVGLGITGLFGWHRLITPTQAVEFNRLYRETCIIDRTTFPPLDGAWGSWVPELIPFATFNDCDLCVHAESGQVWEFRPGGGLLLNRPSIAAVLRELIVLVQDGREPRIE